MTKSRWSKYNVKKVEYDGIVFDSKAEMNRYIQLKELQDYGEIRDLQVHVRFMIIPKTDIYRASFYEVDFVYVAVDTGIPVYEDVKGYRGSQAYALFRIKQKLMYLVHGIRVIEIDRNGNIVGENGVKTSS